METSILFSIQSNATSQHWQDERLTGQIPNQSGHCLLTGHYFKPCSAINTKPLQYDWPDRGSIVLSNQEVAMQSISRHLSHHFQETTALEKL